MTMTQCPFDWLARSTAYIHHQCRCPDCKAWELARRQRTRQPTGVRATRRARAAEIHAERRVVKEAAQVNPGQLLGLRERAHLNALETAQRMLDEGRPGAPVLVVALQYFGDALKELRQRK